MATRRDVQQIGFIKEIKPAQKGEPLINGRKASTYEKMMKKIAGITSAKLKADARGDILECHVLADTTRNVKQIVRDIQSVLMAKYDLELDYKKISVAQVHQITPSSAEAKTAVRVVIGPMNISYLKKHINVSVTLIGPNEEYVGEDVGNDSPDSRIRAIAGATIDAVNNLLKIPAAYELLEVKRVTVAGQEACLVAVCGRNSGSEERHLGCVLIRGDENRAAVRAVLDAVNRRLHMGLEGAKQS